MDSFSWAYIFSFSLQYLIFSLLFLPLSYLYPISIYPSQLQDCVITAIGVGSGTANLIIPFMVLLVVFMCTKLSCLVRKRLIKDVYTNEERERALCHLAIRLLTVCLRHSTLIFPPAILLILSLIVPVTFFCYPILVHTSNTFDPSRILSSPLSSPLPFLFFPISFPLSLVSLHSSPFSLLQTSSFETRAQATIRLVLCTRTHSLEVSTLIT